MNNNFYSAPSYMTGGYTVYGGYRRQRGAGILGSFRRMMTPIGKQALSGIKTIARNKTVQDIAKKAAEKSAEVLTGVAVDALQGRNVGESFKERARNAALESLGVGTSPEAYAKPAPRKRRAKKLKQKKRSAPAKTIAQPPAKKRRRTLSRAALNRKNLF